MKLQAPFPWFGGKSRVAPIVWERFGDIGHYIEPFFGSGAVLLGRPNPSGIETVNDLDCYLINFWRAVQQAPNEVAEYADYPVTEVDLHSRHKWLIEQKENLKNNMRDDPEYFDPKIAGWWVWGISCWIGGDWCNKTSNQKPHLSKQGMGVHKKSLSYEGAVLEVMENLSKRLRYVRILNREWHHILSPSILNGFPGKTGIFFDPPYDVVRNMKYNEDDKSISQQVREWCLQNGDNPKYRIALCGYVDEHVFPDTWTMFQWEAQGGYANQGNSIGKINAKKECIWFSPYCVDPSIKLFNI